MADPVAATKGALTGLFGLARKLIVPGMVICAVFGGAALLIGGGSTALAAAPLTSAKVATTGASVASTKAVTLGGATKTMGAMIGEGYTDILGLVKSAFAGAPTPGP